MKRCKPRVALHLRNGRLTVDFSHTSPKVAKIVNDWIASELVDWKPAGPADALADMKRLQLHATNLAQAIESGSGDQ